MFVYVTAADDGAVFAYSMNRQTGKLTPIAAFEAGLQAMPMAANSKQDRLYVVIRSAPYRVAIYEINAKSGALAKVSEIGLPESMAYVSMGHRDEALYFASYGGNLIATLQIDANGFPNPQGGQIIPTGQNAHAILADRTGRYVFVTNLGSDVILQFTVEPQTGQLKPNNPSFVKTKTGAGPRHIAISPDNCHLYVLAELSGDLIHYTLDTSNGTLAEQSSTSILPDGSSLKPGLPPGMPFTHGAHVWAADLAITPDGRFLYTTERSNSMITIFRLVEDQGTPIFSYAVETEKQPRGIAIEPGGRFLIASGEKSDRLSVYDISSFDGSLSLVDRFPVGAGANWVEIVERRQET